MYKSASYFSSYQLLTGISSLMSILYITLTTTSIKIETVSSVA